MWYTILLKYAFTHYDTFYYYIIAAPFCQGRFFIFVGMPPKPLDLRWFSVILHKRQFLGFRCVRETEKNFCVRFTFSGNHGILREARRSTAPSDNSEKTR